MDKFLKKNHEEINFLYIPTLHLKHCANYVSLNQGGQKRFIILTEIPKIDFENENVSEILKRSNIFIKIFYIFKI